MQLNFLQRLKSVTTLIFDVDGVLTDGNFLLSEDRNHLRFMNTKDGYALQKAVRRGYLIVILSGNRNEGARARFESLGITNIYLGRDDKDVVVKEIIAENSLNADQILYMGDDMPDLKAMRLIGLPICPSDAAIDVLAYSHYISPYGGGKGCVRDILEKLMKLNKQW